MQIHEAGLNTPDWDRLERSDWFSQPDPETGSTSVNQELWNGIRGVREALQNHPHDVVYYPGAFRDVPNALAVTDGTTFVFSDPAYEDPSTKEAVMETLSRDLGVEAESGQEANEQDGAYTTIRFNFGGVDRTLYLHPFDAAQRLPSRLSQKGADVLLLKNTYGLATQLDTDEGVEALLAGVSPEGSVVSYDWIDESAMANQGFATFYDTKVGERAFLGQVTEDHLRAYSRPL